MRRRLHILKTVLGDYVFLADYGRGMCQSRREIARRLIVTIATLGELHLFALKRIH